MTNQQMSIINNLCEMLIIETKNATIKYVNPVFYDFFGYAEEETIGKRLWDFLLPEDRRNCDMEHIVTPQNPSYRVEGRVKKANGEICLVQFVGKGYFDASGELYEFQEMCIDISEWKKAIEEKTKELEKLNFNISSSGSYNSASSRTRGGGNSAVYNFADIITGDVKMKKLISQAKSISSSDLPVLIEGESGTGKELFAQSIHNSSNRAFGPFVAINCGSIPSELINSEFFGYEEGSFTGASRGGKMGKIEMASGGTLFLDEIGEMPLKQQIALLRVLETNVVSKVGSNTEIPVDIRIICATNRNLSEEIANGTFREDLFYRINVVNLKIPPLRSRKGDIDILVDHFFRLNVMKHFIDKKTDIIITAKDVFTHDKLQQMRDYTWPGNVRELQNVVNRFIYVPDYDFLEYIKSMTSGKAAAGKPAPKENEKGRIIDALQEFNGNITSAARYLKMSRKTLYAKIEKYDIER